MITYLYFYRQNYVFLQVGFQRISFETREEFASYGPESLLGKWDIRIKIIAAWRDRETFTQTDLWSCCYGAPCCEHDS